MKIYSLKGLIEHSIVKWNLNFYEVFRMSRWNRNNKQLISEVTSIECRALPAVSTRWRQRESPDWRLSPSCGVKQQQFHITVNEVINLDALVKGSNHGINHSQKHNHKNKLHTIFIYISCLLHTNIHQFCSFDISNMRNEINQLNCSLKSYVGGIKNVHIPTHT